MITYRLAECSAAISPNCSGDRLLTWKRQPVCDACQAELDHDNDSPYAILPRSFDRSLLTVTADCPGHYSYKGKPVVWEG